MQIRFTNYKRVYIILGVFLFLIISLYIASAQVRKSREKSLSESNINSGSVNNSPEPSRVVGNMNGSNVEELESVKYLVSKTMLISNSVTRSSNGYLNDPVFSEMSIQFQDKILSEMQDITPPVSVRFNKIVINPDGRSGITYITITNSSGEASRMFVFTYLKNYMNEWKFADFRRELPS